MTTKQPTARQAAAALKKAQTELATKQTLEQAKLVEQRLQWLEAPQPIVVPWSEYPAFDMFRGFAGYERPYLWSGPEDRVEGRFRPYYETDQDLKVMRASARRFQAMFPVAEGCLEALTNYVVGEGFEITCQPKKRPDDPNAQALCGIVQKTLDRFVEYNDLTGCLDREIHTQARAEGEVFCALYPDEKEIRIDLVSPDYILEPINQDELNRWLRMSHKYNHWHLGVHTLHCLKRKRDDAVRPLGYHAVFDNSGEAWDYLPVGRVQHIKLNVPSEARRGVSDFFMVQRELELEAKLRRNTAEGAAILAAIVMIRQHAEGVTKSSVESMVGENRTHTVQRYNDTGSRSVNSEQIQPGTVKDIPFGMTATTGPMGTLAQPVYIEVSKHLQRLIWQRWNAPDFMTGDASAQNYATALVSEAPFVKARENDQRTFGRHFERLIWKALRMYHAYGQLGDLSWETIYRNVQLKFDYPEVASRDKKEQAETNKVLYDAGVISLRTWTSETGHDFDEEQRQIATEPKKPEPVQAMLPGFGQPDQQPPKPNGPPKPNNFRTETLAIRAMDLLLEQHRQAS